MAISKIINNAESVVLEPLLSLVQTTSDGGIRKAQRRGPLRWKVEVTVPIMSSNSQEFKDIQNEIITLDYGVNTINSQLPNTVLYNDAPWPRQSGGTGIRVQAASQVGSSIVLKGFPLSTSSVVKQGQWLQFSTNKKSYQVQEDGDSNGGGNCTVKLNTPLVGSPALNDLVIQGNSVELKVALISYDAPVHLPQSASSNVVQSRTFIFEEVL